MILIVMDQKRFKWIVRKNSPMIFLAFLLMAFAAGCTTNTANKDVSINITAEETVLKEVSLNNNVEIDTTIINKDYLLGKFNPSLHILFEKIEPELTTINNGYLRKEALDAFRDMHNSAKEDGITLKIVSATRNFNRQKAIWEAKWLGKTVVEGIDLTTISDLEERSRMILLYSSMPGTSRHHWGTDIDINSVSPDYFKTDKGIQEYKWLSKNAGSFGFCQTYTKKDSLRDTGYEEEPWHWSYTPVASPLLSYYISIIDYSDIKGFHGESTAKKLDVINNYVLGINPDCL